MGTKTDSGMINKTSINFPGPGAHSPNPVYKNYGNFKSSKGERQGSLMSSSTSRFVPAPNAYNPRTTLVVQKGAEYTFFGGGK